MIKTTYKIGYFGIATPGTGVGEHVLNVSTRLPPSFKAEIISNFLLRRREAWAFEPFPTLLFAMTRSKHHIIHSHNESALLQSMKTGAKTITTVHLHPQRVMDEYLKEVSLKHEQFNPLYLAKLLINRAQWHRMLTGSERIIATCREHVSLLSRLHGIPAERFRYIPNGVDTATYIPKAERKELQGLFVGEEFWRKGMHYLFNAFKIASRELPGLKLAVVSSRLPHDLDSKLAKSVRLYPHLNKSQLIELYRASSFLILPSLAETTPLVVLESMSCGTPAIAFPVDGIPEVITDGVDGVLVPQRNTNELAKAILKLCEDPSYAERLGTRARQTALKYDWSRVAAQTAEIYLEVIENAPI